MRRLFALVLPVLLLAVVIVTAQDNAPVIVNQHAGLPPFTSVINNPMLIDEPTLLNVNGRNVEVPPGWSYTGFPGVGGLAPYVSRYDGPGYRFSWDWINGRAGFVQDGIQLYGDQRYAIRVEYRTTLKYGNPDMPFVPSDFQMQAQLYTTQGGMQPLPALNMQGLDTLHNIEWVIESTENPLPFVRLEILMDVEWPIFVDNVLLHSIDIVTVPDDYRSEFVLNFR